MSQPAKKVFRLNDAKNPLKQVGQIIDIPIDQLFVDQTYQRQLHMSFVDKLTFEFMEISIGIIIVSRRGIDLYAILDGQHRAEVLRRLGYTHVRCQVYENLTIAQEAETYRKLNGKKKIKSLENFRAEIASGNPNACAIRQLAYQYGFNIPFEDGAKKNAMSLKCPMTLMNCREKYGSSLFDRVFHVITHTYKVDNGGIENDAIKATFVEALCRSLSSKTMSISAIVKRLSQKRAGQIAAEARMDVMNSNSDLAFTSRLTKHFNKLLEES